MTHDRKSSVDPRKSIAVTMVGLLVVAVAWFAVRIATAAGSSDEPLPAPAIGAAGALGVLSYLAIERLFSRGAMSRKLVVLLSALNGVLTFALFSWIAVILWDNTS